MRSILRALGGVFKPLFMTMARQRLPTHAGRLKLTGLEGSVEILRDRWGVPHIYAGSEWDVFFAMGFVHAQDRFWQMEVSRRVTQGLLSEVFGVAALGTDRLSRTFGFRRLAQQAVGQLDDRERGGLEAYAAGVNACLVREPLPIEFALTRHTPARWDLVDSLTQARFLSWNMSHAWSGTLLRAKLIEALGPELFSELDVQYPEANPTIVPDGIDVRTLDPSDRIARAVMEDAPESGLAGSNSWVIPPHRSTTGAPILANDMHLELRLPGIWYLAHYECAEKGLRMTGASSPGLPTVVVGHNAHIGWGATLGFADQQDLYVEKVDPEDPGRYLTPDGSRPFETVVESIPVKGREKPYEETVRYTRHGPVLDGSLDVAGSGADGRETLLALRSVPLEHDFSFGGFFDLQYAKDFDEFTQAVSRIKAPPLNLVYVDDQGNSGYWLTSLIPRRPPGQGRVPMPGWTDEHEWDGYVPFDEMPHLLNPEHEIIVTANHRVVGDDYPHYLGASWMNGYRARRVRDVLDPMAKISPEDCVRLQMDVHCIPGVELKSILADITDAAAPGSLLLEILRSWDGRLTPDSRGGAVYEVLLRHLVRNLLAPLSEDDLVQTWLGKGPHPVYLGNSELYGHTTPALLRILKDPDSKVLAAAGGRAALVQRALDAAHADLSERLGSKYEDWTWGRMHRAVFDHAMSQEPALDSLFGIPRLPVGGDTDTVHQTASKIGDGFENDNFSPSFRQLLQPQDWSKSKVMIVPGQSGHPASPHYGDLVEPWTRGEFVPMLWDRPEVEAECEARLHLEPGEDEADDPPKSSD